MRDVFRKIHDEKAEISASNLYSKKLAFHNFFHVIETLKFANKIINSLLIELSTINLETIYYALLFHDAGYIEDQASMGYADKESYSAALAEEYLLGRGMPPVDVSKVTMAIKATHISAECKNLEEEIVRGADISGMAAPYNDFLEMSKAVKTEQEYLIGEKISWANWVRGSEIHLKTYLCEKISCGKLFTKSNKPSLFNQRLISNIDQLKQEIV
ncbi:MAG: hypothetical protein ACPGN6_00425 [Gammaproteobacteria bacterium]|jgi:predicted metal-dependent HD superfamily phosphohydrolase